MNKFRLGVLTGGPSGERGISLNSARSVMDHLESEEIEIVPIYFDQRKNPYRISCGQLYSNTPSDFDFKLGEHGKSLSPRQFEAELKNCDLVFPTIHGQFGEDGDLQKRLEQLGVPFVGSSSEACKRCFDKFNAAEFLSERGFFTSPNALLKIYKNDHEEIIKTFFQKHGITRAIVKPATGGSSLGVYSVRSPDEALEKAALLFSKRMDSRVVMEPFAQGIEFTVIILQNSFGLPVALVPTEVEADYEQNQIFDYRKKYLPTRQVTFHCPPRFSDEMVERIQVQAEQLFSVFGMSDFARFDGWVLENGEIWFSDFNPISGMEQNSFLFQQSARIGLSHRSALLYIIEHACERYDIKPPQLKTSSATKKDIAVVFGGDTSERQVSLMSGSNVWLKLRRSEEWHPTPYVMEASGYFLNMPYALLLNHTVEEVVEACRTADIDEERLRRFERNAQLRLAIPKSIPIEKYFPPKRYSIEELAERHEFVFVGLHGGKGEDGTFQRMLEERGIAYNGSGPLGSDICMDKYRTGEILKNLEDDGILVCPKRLIDTKPLFDKSETQIDRLWDELTQSLQVNAIIVKPYADGCSSGIVCLNSAGDLRIYLEYLKSRSPRIPAGHFEGQAGPVEMPTSTPSKLLFEPFIETEKIRAVQGEIKTTERSGWIEVTVGVLEDGGVYHSLAPSLTIAEGDVLSLEEKFQGGTGINVTPPPEELLTYECCSLVKSRIEKVAELLNIQGYARIDAFVERKTGRVMIIEANTLPALTPSTVLFHQGIAEDSMLMPLALLETIIRTGISKRFLFAESKKQAVA